MSRKAIVVAGLSAVAFAASGCTGGSNEAEHPLDITKFRAEVKERFGTPPNEAPWYRHITAINWANEQTLEITADLDESESRIPCGLLWRLAFEQADKPNSLGVQIVGSDGGGQGGCA